MSAATSQAYGRHKPPVTSNATESSAWDQQLDSLLSDLNEAAPTGPRRTPTVPASPIHQISLRPEISGMPGNEDFHERQEYTSPDQRTKTVEERSRRTARSDGGQQVVTEQTFKTRSSSSLPAGNDPGNRLLPGGAPQLEINGDDIRDLKTLLPDIDAPIAPGQTRVIKYDIRKTHQRSVSPQPVQVRPVPSTPPPAVKPKPRVQIPPPTQPLTSPLSETVGSYSSVNEHTRTVERTPALLTPVKGPPSDGLPPAANTTINYHIYNYGAVGPDGLPVEGVPPPGSNLSTIERHETHQQSSAGHPTTAYTPPVGRHGPSGGHPSNTIEKYETRQYTSSHSGSSPAVGGYPRSPARDPSPVGSFSPPPGIPGSKSSAVERYETRQHTTSGGRPPSSYDNPPQEMSSATRQYTSNTNAPGSGYPDHRGGYPPSDSFHTRTVTREVETSRTAGRGDSGPFPTSDGGPHPEMTALVPRQPQDATYPDGPRRRDVTTSQAPMTSLDDSNSDVTPQLMSPSKGGAAGVYYPPDMNADQKWKSVEKSKNGNTKTKFQAEGSYKAKGGSKQKDDKGGKTIPICLPLCGGAACSVM